MNVVETNGLDKRYGSIWVLRGCSSRPPESPPSVSG